MTEHEKTPSFWDDFSTFLWVRYYNFIDLLKTMALYWRRPKFALVDLTLLLRYFFKSPYRIGREFNEDEPYGETPLITLSKLVEACPLTANDIAYELGSGRGRCAFWLALYKGIQTVGIENNPIFVERAQQLATFFHVDKVQFRLEDITKANFQEATWIYLYGTALSDNVICEMAKNFQKLKAGTKIITISYSLNDYVKESNIRLVNQLDVDFAWGSTLAYIHEVC